MRRILAFIFSLKLTLLAACLTAQNSDFLIDERDGNVYLVAKFKDTWWMCQNLKFDAGKGSACFNEDETNCMLEGRLYNQAAALKACPEGYHLPSDEEWKALESYVGMQEDELNTTRVRSSGETGKYLKAGGGIGFDAELVGMINPSGKSVQSGFKAFFWASDGENGIGWVRVFSKNNEGVERKMIDSKHMLSVRCVKKGMADPGSDPSEDKERGKGKTG